MRTELWYPTKKEKVCWSSGQGPWLIPQSGLAALLPERLVCYNQGRESRKHKLSKVLAPPVLPLLSLPLGGVRTLPGHLPFPFRQTHPWPAFASGFCGPRPRLVPTLTGNAQEASGPEHNWHRNRQELLFRWPTAAGQVGSEPFRVLSADSRCDLDFLIFPSCALFSHHSHQTPTFPGPRFLPAAQFHSPTADPCCSQRPDPLPWLPSYTLNLASNSPALALSQPYVLRLKDSVYRKKTQLWGEEIQVGKYTLQIFPLLNKFTLLGSFPCDSAGKESACNVRDLGSIPGLGRSPGEGNGYPLEYSGLENSMDCIVHGGAKSWTRLSNFHFTFTFVRPNTTEQT